MEAKNHILLLQQLYSGKPVTTSNAIAQFLTQVDISG